MAGRSSGGHKTDQLKNILLKVILLGDGGVGKSCLMNRFVSNRFDAHSFHTIGVEFLNKEIEVNGQLYTLQIWDTAGQERFKSLRTPFYRGSDICILTFSLDDANSFHNLKSQWRDEFLFYADVPEKDRMHFPFVVIGNKVDIDPELRCVAQETVIDFCNSFGTVPYIECSAKDGKNVDSAFMAAVERWVKLEAKIEKPYTGPTLNLGGRGAADEQHRSSSSSARSSCCN